MRLKAMLIVLIPSLMSAAHQEPAKGDAKQLAKEVLVKGPEFDDLSAILHITKRSGHVKLNPGFKTARLEVEFYRKGQKLPNTLKTGYIGHYDRSIDRIDFVMQALDTDYLPVAGSKKNHCRLMMGVKIGAASTNRPFDVDKALFDFSSTTGSATFTAAASSDDKIPLFWFVTNTNENISTDTVEGVVEGNKTGDLAIFFLRVKK